MNTLSIIKGNLELCVLSILKKEKSYGYAINNALKKNNLELKGGGSIYSILSKIKDKGLVNISKEEGENGQLRVYYELNLRGEEYLEKEIKEWLIIHKDIINLFVRQGVISRVDME